MIDPGIEAFRSRLPKRSFADLQSMLAGIDCEKYPERFQSLVSEISARGDIGSKDEALDDPVYLYGSGRLRCLAHVLDLLILWPVFGLCGIALTAISAAWIWWGLAYILIEIGYHILVVQRFGGTFGDRLLGLKIEMLDGSRLSILASAKRHSVALFLCVFAMIPLVASLGIVDAMTSFQMLHDPRLLWGANTAVWNVGFSLAYHLWVLSEFVTMRFSTRRRSWQDLMAGTIIYRRISRDRSFWFMGG